MTAKKSIVKGKEKTSPASKAGQAQEKTSPASKAGQAQEKASPVEEKAPGRKSGAAKTVETKAMEVTLDARSGKDRRKASDRREADVPVAVERRQVERRVKVNRRRQIDPTTCERDYSNEEIEFMNAMDAYKRRSGRMFPTCSEVLEVIRGLGYEKQPLAPPPPAPVALPEMSAEPVMAEMAV